MIIILYVRVIAASLRMSSGSMLHSISHALVGVVFMAPLMTVKLGFVPYPMLQGFCMSLY